MIREIVREKIDKGYKEDEIIELLSQEYGNNILYETSNDGGMIPLWILPIVIFCIGAVAFYKYYKELNR